MLWRCRHAPQVVCSLLWNMICGTRTYIYRCINMYIFFICHTCIYIYIVYHVYYIIYCIYIYIEMYYILNISTCNNMQLHVHKILHMYVYIYVYICIHTNTHIYIYTYDIYMYTLLYTQVCMLKKVITKRHVYIYIYISIYQFLSKNRVFCNNLWLY